MISVPITPPRKLTYEGLGRDSLLKMVHDPGPGWRVVPNYILDIFSDPGKCMGLEDDSISL